LKWRSITDDVPVGTVIATLSEDGEKGAERILANCFIRNIQTAFGQQMFNITKAQGEPCVKPNRMNNYFRWKVVAIE